MTTFRGWLVTGADGGTLTELTDADLGSGEILVDVDYSSINFKDGLALMGKPGVIRTPPLIAGIDLVGTVAEGTPEWPVGTRVIVNGRGLGEEVNGGLAERARVKAEWLVRLPEGFSPVQAAAIGTAGFTAMLAVLAVESRTGGEVLVTGASGGVGSIAVAILARLGFSVTASTGRASEHPYLRELGASAIIDRAELSEKGKPLQAQRWTSAIDSVGGDTLANVLAQTTYGGIVASCGLAASADLPTTVMPFILRGVTLAGINSVYCPPQLRAKAWERLVTDLDTALLDSLTETVGLADARVVAERILNGGVRGRTVVDVRN